ncbi:hypothetical protein E2I00_004526 [Balaenoptera physalus]|uniref:Vascular endothelial growth factor A n=1 Tax=Balaenoptera physalus TaxID=9770 RepID=A0A643CCE4_BALPH|nr:hypothetical protein E2I00_004526 [Balaenoptera physalus]
MGSPTWVWLAGSLTAVICFLSLQIMRIKPHQGQHIGEMSFLQHNKCECRPKKDRARQEKSEAGQRRSAPLAREKEVNVGHFLRLSVAQCGGSGQDRAGDVTSQGGEPGGRKEPPSGFRERDVSPGKTDTE